MTDTLNVKGWKMKKGKTAAYYTLLFAVISLLSFSFFLIFNKSLLYEADGVLQHYTNLVKLRQIISDMIHGNGFSFWSDEVAMGGDTVGNLSMLTLCDPFAYIAAAFPVKYMDIGYGVAVVLRLYCAGLAMLGFIRYRGFSDGKCILAGISYAFCYWGMGVIRHGFFLLPMILFPLVIWGIEKVLQKESPWLLIFSVGFSFLSSVYFSYMTGIMAAVYVLVRYFAGEENKSAGKFFGMIFRLIGYIVVSCCLAAPVLVVAVYALLSCSTSSGIELDILPTLKQLLLYVPSLTTKTEVISYFSFTGVNALFTLLIPFALFGLKDKEKRIPCIMFLFSIVMVVFPLWGSFMNAFSYASGRWCYALAFFFVWMGTEQLEQFRKMSGKKRKICAGWTGILVVATLVSGMVFGVLSSEDMAFSFFEIGFMFFLLQRNNLSVQKLLIVLVLNIGIGYCIQFSPFGDDSMNAISEFAGIGETYERYEDSVLRGTTAIKEDDYYRVDYAEHLATSDDKYLLSCMPANESVFWDARTICGYYSTIDSSVFDYNKQVLNSQNYCRRTSVFSNDNRSRLNFLQGVKYYLQEEENRNELIDTENYAGYGFSGNKTKKGVKIQKSKFNAGLGYVMPKVVSSEEYASQSPLKSEQTMMQAAVLDGDDIRKYNVENLLANPSELSYEDSEAACEISDKTTVDWKGKNAFDVSENKNMIFLSVPKLEKVELYVEFKNLKRVPYTAEEKAELFRENNQEEPSAYENKLDKLNSLTRGEPTDEFSFYACLGNVKKLVTYISNMPQGIAPQSDFMAHIGYFDKVSDVVNLTFLGQGHYTFDSLKIYAVKQDNFEEQASQLSNNRFTAVQTEDDCIRGTVNSAYDGWLYLNLVYNKGWKAYVDGVETELVRTDTCFSGLPVSSGQHEIVLEYYPYGLNYGLLAFAAGVVACIAIALFRKLRLRHRN